ncbi:MAG: hypothetical protein KAW41_01810 [Candidatus Diapherotrites archaeon]|nr:hypothetical protein [Candidatus Diapherotrites archaeon]
MDIGFTGNAIVVLKAPIDDEEPVRIYADLLGVNDAGVTVSFEDSEEEKRTCFIPFSNIRCIEKAEAPGPEAETRGMPAAKPAASPQGGEAAPQQAF